MRDKHKAKQVRLLEHQFYTLYFKHFIILQLYSIFKQFSRGLLQNVNLDRPNSNPSLEWSWDSNTFLLRKNTPTMFLEPEILRNTQTWLVPNNIMWFVIIKIKSESVPLGQQGFCRLFKKSMKTSHKHDLHPLGGHTSNQMWASTKMREWFFNSNADFIKKETRRSRSTLNVTVALIIKMQAWVASRSNSNVGLSNVAFQLQREHMSSTFQDRCEPMSSAPNNRLRSASSARPAFCCNWILLLGQLTAT